MSGDGAPPQPPGAPKGPATTSSFINKGAKTFAPKKAIRRRPAPAAAPKPVESSKPPEPAIDTASASTPVEPWTSSESAVIDTDAQSSSEPQSVQVTSTSEPAVQETSPLLPTPPTTQQPTEQAVPRTEEPVVTQAEDISNLHAAGPALGPEPLATPVSTIVNTVPRPDDAAKNVPEQVEEDSVLAPASTAPVESAQPPQAGMPTAIDTIPIDPRITSSEPTTAVEEQTIVTSEGQLHANEGQETVPTAHASEHAAPIDGTVFPDATAEASTARAPALPKGRKRRWTAVNSTREEREASAPAVNLQESTGVTPQDALTDTGVMNGETNGTASQSAAQPLPKGRRRRKPVTLRNMDEGEEDGEDGAQDETAARPVKRAKRKSKAVATQEATIEDGQVEQSATQSQSEEPSATARGKRKATEASATTGDNTVQPPAKKRRQPRKPTTPAVVRDDSQDIEPGAAYEGEGATQNGEGAQQVQLPSMPRKRKQQSRSQSASAGQGASGEQQPKRKGRPAREPTPEGAEDEVIDPEEIFMDDLARRNIRVGKLSNREKKMREVNWEEIKQRQREMEMAQTNNRALQAELERQMLEADQANRERQGQPQYEVVDNSVRIVAGSGDINHEQDAQRELDRTETIEEDDFTNRITQRSFLRNNKRFPEEFLLPGQGKQWNFQDTEDFYNALAMFGTDFGMMTTLFPGVTRRSIKLKFNREEKKNPMRIKTILQNATTGLKWDNYIKGSGRDEAAFERVEEIKKEMEAERLEMEAEIEKAKEAAAEEKRQRRMAGVDSDAENDENQPGKKGKKGKGKQVTFQQEEDVEILEVDENDGWGEDY